MLFYYEEVGIKSMYFRNKFDDEFLFLCNQQEPKGGSIRLDNKDHAFWVFKKRDTRFQPDTVHVIPLLLHNKMTSTNFDDLNIENDLMICKNVGDTKITCTFEENLPSQMDEPFICQYDTIIKTGDLVGKDYEE
ncbi:MAG: hypothetical protein BZ138_07710 [Methanosphaera sp. rholeuAM270]|nr:MAG: hypothetical protein BZ138_07710 [Methanosphaera sp. rholeuAM270]